MDGKMEGNVTTTESENYPGTENNSVEKTEVPPAGGSTISTNNNQAAYPPPTGNNQAAYPPPMGNNQAAYPPPTGNNQAAYPPPMGNNQAAYPPPMGNNQAAYPPPMMGYQPVMPPPIPMPVMEQPDFPVLEKGCLITGILSCVFGLIGFCPGYGSIFAILSFGTGVAALVMSIFILTKAKNRTKKPIAGIVLGSIGVICSIISVVILLVSIAAFVPGFLNSNNASF